MKKDHAEQISLKALVTSFDLPGVTKYVSGNERRQQSNPRHGSVEVHISLSLPQQHCPPHRGEAHRGTSHGQESDGNLPEATCTSFAPAVSGDERPPQQPYLTLLMPPSTASTVNVHVTINYITSTGPTQVGSHNTMTINNNIDATG